jgi:NAD(P)-dependent dehydrogenase (short-subunit alcohol dehydrogenase family)
MALGTAVIVGVGPGLGVALARAFVNAGHPVAMLARDKASLDTYAAELASTGCGGNIAVVGKDSPIGGDDEDWANVTAINVLGGRVAADAVLPELRDGRGSLLFTGGGFALHPPRNTHPLARPRCARMCKCFTTSWRERACTLPASRSRRRSAAKRASTRQ